MKTLENSLLPEAELVELFPTPLLKYQWPDCDSLNRELREVILSKMEESRGNSIWQGSNIGGWHSTKDFDAWPHPCVKDLVGRVSLFVREMVLRIVAAPEPDHLRDWVLCSWANVSCNGDRNASHAHSNERDTLWSGIYYVDAGEGLQPSSGLTKFEDRSGLPKEIIRNPDPHEREFSVSPQAGLMVLFPGRLWHRVEPYWGSGARITIAFNMSHNGFVIPSYPASETSRPGSLRGWMWKNFRGIMLPARFVKRRIQSAFRPVEPH